MLPELIKITNAFSGSVLYVNIQKIVLISAPDSTTPKPSWAHQPRSCVYYGPGEDNYILAAETVESLVDRFPPV